MPISVDLTDNSDLLRKALPEQIERALKKIGFKAEGHAKTYLTESKAVDTGRLRGSITYAVDGHTVYVGTNVEYARFVELGTTKMAARPYIKPAALDHTDEYKQTLKDTLQGV